MPPYLDRLSLTRTQGLHIFLPWQPEAMAADCFPSACNPIQRNASCIGFTALAVDLCMCVKGRPAGLRVCIVASMNVIVPVLHVNGLTHNCVN